MTNEKLISLIEESAIETSCETLADIIREALRKNNIDLSEYRRVVNCIKCRCYDPEREYCTFHHFFADENDFCYVGLGMRKL